MSISTNNEKFFDTRTLFGPICVPNIEIGADGITPVISLDQIQHLIIENEQLKEKMNN